MRDRPTCAGCGWYSIVQTVDIVKDTQYTYLCWRDCGPPQVRTMTNGSTPIPPSCVEKFNDHTPFH